MINTIGNCFDAISILTLKLDAAYMDDHEYFETPKKIKLLIFAELKEMTKNFERALQGDSVFTASKFKMYDKRVDSGLNDHQKISLIDMITALHTANKKLWDLENKRRDMNLSDSERLAAADEVSVNNKVRNCIIEEIDWFVNSCSNCVDQQ